jgi:hypothetical protein
MYCSFRIHTANDLRLERVYGPYETDPSENNTKLSEHLSN